MTTFRSGKDLVKNQDVVIKKVLILNDKQIRSILREIIILRKSCNPHVSSLTKIYNLSQSVHLSIIVSIFWSLEVEVEMLTMS